MNRDFNTTVRTVHVEELTYSGSAFGSTDDGEGVFFNTRVVDRMDLEPGDLVTAHLIPNYIDKRDEIPWRCIRVEEDKVPAGFRHAMDREARHEARQDKKELES